MGQLKKIISIIIFFILAAMGQGNAQENEKPWLTPEKLADPGFCGRRGCIAAQVHLNDTFIKGEPALVNIQVDNPKISKQVKRRYISISEDKDQIRLVTCFMIKNIKTEEIISTSEPPHKVFFNSALSEHSIDKSEPWSPGMQIFYQIDLNEYPEFTMLEPGNYEITFVIMPFLLTDIYPAGPFSFTIKKKRETPNKKVE